MHHDTAPDLCFSPHFRPFYPLDVQGYSVELDRLAYPGDLRAHCTDPTMSLKACRLVGGGIAVRLASTPFELCHGAAHVSPAETGDILATIVIEGEGFVEQAGVRMEYGPGDIAFRSTRLPSTFASIGLCKLIALRLPYTRFFGIYADLPERFIPAMASSGSLLAQAARDHLVHVFPELPQQSAASVYFTEQSFVSLLAAVYFESTSDRSSVKLAAPDRWQQLVAFVESNLSDPEMGVEMIARALRVSKRVTHRLFETNGTQYSTYLKARRLERAHEELKNPKFDQLSVFEIAYRNGFNDPSHFSRSFSNYFGATPGSYRKAMA
jgi:AraC family transcriptional regulator, positive regulator of tynA and feaB